MAELKVMHRNETSHKEWGPVCLEFKFVGHKEMSHQAAIRDAVRFIETTRADLKNIGDTKVLRALLESRFPDGCRFFTAEIVKPTGKS